MVQNIEIPSFQVLFESIINAKGNAIGSPINVVEQMEVHIEVVADKFIWTSQRPWLFKSLR